MKHLLPLTLRMPAVALAAMALTSSTWCAAPVPTNPESIPPPPAPAIAPSAATEDKFHDLKQDAAGNWLVGFEHLASFSFGQHKLDYDAPVKPYGRRKFALLVPEETGSVELPTEPGKSGAIPPRVQALNGKRVRISGYMLPVKLENGLVKECLLLRNQMMCCFGRRPELNEWVIVKMKGKGVPSTMDTPVSFYGTLHVGEMFENGVFEGLYQFDGEKISTQ